MLYFFVVAHKVACQTLSKAFLKSPAKEHSISLLHGLPQWASLTLWAKLLHHSFLWAISRFNSVTASAKIQACNLCTWKPVCQKEHSKPKRTRLYPSIISVGCVASSITRWVVHDVVPATHRVVVQLGATTASIACCVQLYWSQVLSVACTHARTHAHTHTHTEMLIMYAQQHYLQMSAFINYVKMCAFQSPFTLNWIVQNEKPSSQEAEVAFPDKSPLTKPN